MASVMLSRRHQGRANAFARPKRRELRRAIAASDETKLTTIIISAKVNTARVNAFIVEFIAVRVRAA
jgi:hypothetical protein